MSVFKDIYQKGYLNISKNEKPNPNNYGKFYMKSDNLLYFLNELGDEYLLSKQQVLNTIDSLIAEQQSPLNALNNTITTIPFSNLITAADITINNTNDIGNIIIKTAGTYYISYTLNIENTIYTAIGTNPVISTHILLNNIITNNQVESIITYNGNFTYSQTFTSVINVPAYSTCKINVSQTTASTAITASIDITKYDRILINRGNNTDFILLTKSTIDITDNNENKITYDIINEQNNIAIYAYDKSIISIINSGYYYIQYNTSWTCDNNSIINLPELTSFIEVTDSLLNISKEGYTKEIIISDNGNINYNSNITALLKLNTDDILSIKVQQSTSSNAVKFNESNLKIYKKNTQNVLFLKRATAMELPNNTHTPIVWDTTVEQLGTITNNSTQLEIAETGTYQIVYTVILTGTNITGENPVISSYIALNGTHYATKRKSIITNNNSINIQYTKSDQIKLFGGDFIELYIHNITGGSLNASSTTPNQMMKISIIKL